MIKNILLITLFIAYNGSIMCSDTHLPATQATEKTDTDGNTDLHMLTSAPHPKSPSPFAQMPDFQRAQHALRLIENNANVYTPNNSQYKNTPLDYAVHFQEEAPHVYTVINACAEISKLAVQRDKLAKRGQDLTQTARDKWTAQQEALKPYRTQSGAAAN